MAYQKGLNKSRNHHDSLSNSGSGRKRSDSYASTSILDDMRKIGGGHQRPYGQGKHSNGGKPKQKHW